MNNNPYQQAMKQYKSIEIESQVEEASPHQLINLLLQGARNHIATAQGHVHRQQIKEKGEHISKAVSIIEGLKMSVDEEKGGEIAANLLKLYDYIQDILTKANLNNDADLLAQANILLASIHDAWQEIKEA